MKILLKPFRYSVIATTIALVFNQPAFASEFNAQINNQPSSQAKTKSKTNIKKNMQNKISNSAKESVNTYQTEIQRITAAQKLARQKAEMAQKEAEARAIAQVKEKRQQSQIKAQELEQKKAELVQREYLEAKRQVREQEMARQKAEEDRKVAEALAAVKLKNSTQQRLTKEQLAAQKEAERLANEQEIARKKIKANELQRAINEQSKLAEVARVKRTLIEQKQVISPQKEDEILRQQAIEEQRKKEALANAERKRLEAERLAREEEIANQKAEEARKKSEELARRERDRLAREQEIARQKAVEEERQRAIETQRQQEENARIERERAEREEADRLAREQEIAAQQVEEKPEESPVILVRSTAPTDLPSDMAPLDLEDIQGENSGVEKTVTVAPKEHIEMIHDETNSETKTEDVALKVDSTLESQESSNSQPEVAEQASVEQVVASHEETAHQLNAEETISVVKRLTTEIASAIHANLEPSVADAEVIANSEVRESEETEVAPQAPTIYNPNEILVANAIASNVAILNTLNLDLSGRLDRKLDRTSFYRTLGGVWVEYVNSDMHGHGGDTNNYRAKSNQITLGNDEAQLDNGVVLGGTFTHAKTDNQYGPLSGKDTLTKITAYAKQNFDQYSKALDIGYGWSSSKIGNSKLKRKIISVGMNFAYDFELEDFKVTPIWGLRYHHLSSTGGEINGLNVRSPGFSLVAYHTGLKFSNTYNVDGIEVTPAFSTYYVTTLGKSYSQNINGKEFGVAIGPYWHNNASLSIGLRDWKISAYAAVNQGKHGERQNQLGVKLNYYW
ncbi:autotransporter outer membrane beta-barrel domain-containing protein [Aggregatibacter actinomycetemcomitans]|uniref:autotransporter outer membrane beta-barrel domain-containing protein n=1 Tax=Aggregatibacter actinomycetemcomitans TaxID=714 RepID=UPI001E63E70F|nr:adhesin [Aggregatibacter actinomycetemcomitans]